MKKTIANIAIALGVIIIFGTAGASDMGNIDMLTVAAQCVIGLGLLIGGLIGGDYVANWR